MLQSYTITILDKNTEGILWVQLRHKQSSKCVIVCTCYLPPKGTTRPVDGEEFFDRLLTDVYQYQNLGQIIIGGDFNARCGSHSDYVEGVDEVTDRLSIDEGENIYGGYHTLFS
jgi:hypothetical protein